MALANRDIGSQLKLREKKAEREMNRTLHAVFSQFSRASSNLWAPQRRKDHTLPSLKCRRTIDVGPCYKKG